MFLHVRIYQRTIGAVYYYTITLNLNLEIEKVGTICTPKESYTLNIYYAKKTRGQTPAKKLQFK